MAAEPGSVAPRAAAAPATSRDFVVRVKFVGDSIEFFAPKVRIHDGQSATVADETQRAFVIGETTVDGARKPAIRVASEGTRLDVRVTSSSDAEHVLLDLTAEFQEIVDDEAKQSGPFQTVRVKSNRRQLFQRVRLGQKTVVEFDDVKLEIVVAAVE